MSDLSSLKNFLEDKVALMKTIHSSLDWKYSCFEELILDCGIAMEPIPLPNNIESGLPSMCYSNCQQVLTKHKHLVYVEGYAVREGVPFPVPHAWLSNETKKALDPTWETSGICYLGVPFSTKWVKSILNARNGKIRELSIFEGNYLEKNLLLKQGFPSEALITFYAQN